MATEDTPESTPFVYEEADLSPLQKQGSWLQNKLLGIGSFATEHDIPFLKALDDPYYTGNVARNLTFGSEFIPGFGDIQGAREGEHMRTHGQPKLGAAMVGLSALPFVPFTPIKKALERGLKTTPTKVMRTNTGDQAVSDAYYTPEGGYQSPDAVNYDALREGRLNYESNAERQLLSNPDYDDPTKVYNVDEFIDSTVANSPKEIQTTVRNQLDDWVSPDLRGSEVTTQELLDDIGKNKPTIQENYMEGTGWNPPGGGNPGRGDELSQYMPDIPTTNANPNPLTALETVYPDIYTERSFSYHTDQGKLFDDPGHTEVSVGYDLEDLYDSGYTTSGDLPPYSGSDYSNTANRIFTTRSGMYDIDGVETYIAAEGQSGIYRMGTASGKGLEAVTPVVADLDTGTIDSLLHPINPYGETPMDDMLNYLDEPYPIAKKRPRRSVGGFVKTYSSTKEIPHSLPSREDFLKALDGTGNTLDDWNAVVKEYKDYIEKQVGRALNRQASSPTTYPGAAVAQAQRLAREDARGKYIPKLLRMINKRGTPQEIERLGLKNGAPWFREWFPIHMKTSINDAVERGAARIRFPINDYSVAKATGQPIVPARARQFKDEYTQELDEVTNSYTPSEEAEALGKIYKKRTQHGITRIEAEYGIKLNPIEVIDDNKNRFLEITLTPELREAFETIVFNRGGAVCKKPLMNLKY